MLLLAVLSLMLAQDAPRSPAAPADYAIGPHDVLSVVVFGEGDLTRAVAVDADGTFEFPHIGRIAAGGLTVRRVADVLTARLRNLYVNPQVSVDVATFRSQRVFVFGEVRAPGQYALEGHMPVMQALAAAGSPTPAGASHVIISRPAASEPRLPDPEPGGGSTLKVTMKQLQSGQFSTLTLRDGDTVTVPKAEAVYVTGYVKSPGSYVMHDDLTVMQVIAMAGGVSEKGAMNRAKIFRRIQGTLQEVKGVKPSDRVQPGDTIDVPQRYF